MSANPADVKRTLYERAQSGAANPEREQALAAWADPQEEPEWAEFLDFFALEWVDAQGCTLLERVMGPELEAPLLAWILELRNGLYTVDDWAHGVAQVRDLLTEEALRVRVDEPLPRRAVLRSRLLPGPDGVWRPSGEPDLYDPMSAMARIDLAERWAASPRRALSARLAELRRAFVTQREQHAAFVELFGADELITPSEEALQRALDRLLHHLTWTHRAPSRGGATLAERFQALKGREPLRPQAELGENLRGKGRVGVIYDRAEGLHLLPWYGEFVDHMRGVASHPAVVRLYLEDPGVSALPFRRHATAEALAQVLGVPPGDRERMLAGLRPPARQAPSILSLDEP